MEKPRFYTLPKLPYGYKDLEPHISELQLTIHHQKHHQSYVNGANAILEKLDKARKDNADIDIKASLKELSWNIGGHNLHSLFWENMMPPSKAATGPSGAMATEINKEFGNFERFKKEFTLAANSVEGSGWAALTFCSKTKRPLIMQIEKHNLNVHVTLKVIMVLDVFEHAYYIDYKNDRAKFVEAFWKLVNWDKVNERLKEAMQ